MDQRSLVPGEVWITGVQGRDQCSDLRNEPLIYADFLRICFLALIQPRNNFACDNTQTKSLRLPHQLTLLASACIYI